MRQELKINHANSMNNGICFYSKRHKDQVAIATVDKQGNVTAEWTTMKVYRKNKDKHQRIAEMKRIFRFIVSMLPFVIVFSILLVQEMYKNHIYGIRTLLIGYALLLLFSFIVSNSIKRREERRAYKFHSAEHMVINAYRKLGRVPSLEEIHQFSRFCNSCGTNATTQMVVSFILMAVCSFIPNPLYSTIGMLSVNVIVLILLRCGFLNFLQIFTTITPTDKELTVAIMGMNVWFENEKKEKEKSKFLKFLHRLFPRVFN